MADFATSVAEAWLRHEDFTLQQPDDEDKPCVFAQKFSTQLEKLCQPAFSSPTHITINQSLLQICKKYWEWFYVVPARHRNHVEGRQHRCIHGEFRLFYERLKVLELSLAPPMLFLPPPPPPPPPPAEPFAGVTLGEILGEDE